MNTGKSFSLGWAAFGAAGIGGGYLGWRRNQFDQQIRIEENVEHNKRRNELLVKAEEKMKRDGTIKFKENRITAVAKSSPASSTTTTIAAATTGAPDPGTKHEPSHSTSPSPPPTT